MEKNFPDQISDLPVKMFKLVSGESIIAYTHDLDDESNGALIGIEEPMKVQVEDLDSHYVMTPWLPFSNQKLHVLEDFNVMVTTDVTDDVKAHYMKIILDEIQTDKEMVEEQMKIMKGNSTTH
ncbi:MAG TPA: hypothetical protein DCW83_01035 [Saprospirales bacterium]|jgi:hypothetical protein|nr:hypothetical protein [Saprospirales bacterium]